MQSTDTVPKYDGPLFDLFAVDGSHSGDVPYQDMVNGRSKTKKGGYLLIDDWSTSFMDVRIAWSRGKSEGWIEEILCVDNGVVVNGYHKAYCLGRYI